MLDESMHGSIAYALNSIVTESGDKNDLLLSLFGVGPWRLLNQTNGTIINLSREKDAVRIVINEQDADMVAMRNAATVELSFVNALCLARDLTGDSTFCHS